MTPLQQTVRRIQRIMAVLLVCALVAPVLQSKWHAAGVLTLTVAAAIVQLRWLASQVSHLVTLAALTATDPAAEPVETGSPVGTEGDDHVSPDLWAAETSSLPTGSATDPTQEIASPPKPSVPKTFSLVVLRPAILLLGLLALYFYGRSELLALAVGILILPASLMIEALLGLLRPVSENPDSK